MPDNVLQAWRSGVLISVQEQRNAFTIHLITTLAHDVLTRFDTGIINNHHHQSIVFSSVISGLVFK